MKFSYLGKKFGKNNRKVSSDNDDAIIFRGGVFCNDFSKFGYCEL